jgi:hypothetical protein
MCTHDTRLHVYSLDHASSTAKCVHSFDAIPSDNKAFSGPLSFDSCSAVAHATRLEINSNASHAAVIDTKNRVAIFDLIHYQLLDMVAGLESRAVGVAFHPTSSVVAVACATNHFVLYDFALHRLTDWSRRNGHAISQLLLKQEDKVCGVVFNPSSPQLLFLYAVDYCVVVDTAMELASLPVKKAFYDEAWSRPHNVVRNDTAHTGMAVAQGSGTRIGEGCAIRLFRRFRPLLHFAFAGAKDLVVVERSWLDVLGTMPETLNRHRYGT